MPDENKQFLAPNTTEEQDRVTAGQRNINIIWEVTQSLISIIVVLANMIVAIYEGLGKTSQPFPVVLSSALFLVVGFYFSRTNHSAIGGVGPKAEAPYVGR